MDVKGCIFDLDGVIVDTAKYHFLAWKKLADQLNIAFTENDNERLKGVGRMDYIEIILEIGKVRLTGEMKRKYAQLKNEWYVGYISRMTPDEILPGSIEFINEIKGAGIRTAIGSASKNTPMILERLGIKYLFDAVADGNSVEKAKPDPEVFLAAARMISVNPGDCVVFEDAAAGVQAALNAGMTCVGIGSERILKEAHYIVPGLYEMNLEILNKIHGRRR